MFSLAFALMFINSPTEPMDINPDHIVEMELEAAKLEKELKLVNDELSAIRRNEFAWELRHGPHQKQTNEGANAAACP